ncbi:MAG: hypothetical protein D6726_07930 [Nitrospirae bacterium]|nr:MAG: hypothetical protein D6726_07930 [Nitrospirota bacterium]
MNFLEAVRALKEGRCRAIKYKGWDEEELVMDNKSEPRYLAFKYINSHNKCRFGLEIDTYCGDWELVDEIVNETITPKPGEVWEREGQKYWVVEVSAYDVFTVCFIGSDGRRYSLGGVQHNKNGWRRVWPEVGGE